VLDRGTARAVIVTFHDIGAAAPAPAVPPAAPRPPPDRDAPAGADPDEASARLWAQLDPLIALNEELLASSDALQATNEHLHTVADDHQRRLRELRDATGELAAVIDASRTGAILVDRELGIVRFTERIAPIFRLQPGDLGRRLSDLAHDLDRASLYDELAQVIAGAPPVSAQVRAADGTRYLLRIAPYAPDDAPAGAILSLVEQPA
jgi:two-component system CheB/CheR fusion protein